MKQIFLFKKKIIYFSILLLSNPSFYEKINIQTLFYIFDEIIEFLKYNETFIYKDEKINTDLSILIPFLYIQKYLYIPYSSIINHNTNKLLIEALPKIYDRIINFNMDCNSTYEYILICKNNNTNTKKEKKIFKKNIKDFISFLSTVYLIEEFYLDNPKKRSIWITEIYNNILPTTSENKKITNKELIAKIRKISSKEIKDKNIYIKELVNKLNSLHNT